MPKGQLPCSTSAVPDGPLITDDDRRMLPAYLRLVDAEAAGASWDEAARNVLGIDPARASARSIYDRHLARARWIVGEGWKQLLPMGLADPPRG